MTTPLPFGPGRWRGLGVTISARRRLASRATCGKSPRSRRSSLPRASRIRGVTVSPSGRPGLPNSGTVVVAASYNPRCDVQGRRSGGLALGSFRSTMVAMVLIGGAIAQARGQSPSAFGGQVAPILAKYCSGCHGPTQAKGGFNLAKYPDEAAVRKDLKAWRKALGQVESGAMPPEGKPRPSDAELAAVVGSLQSLLSKADCSIRQDPGRVTIRRLNREEYNNTVRDLVGVDFRPADDFPSDDVGYGFDNNGDVLSLPPLLMEKYLAAAEAIAEEAVLADDTPRGPAHRWKAATLAKSGDAGHELDSGAFWLMYSAAEVGVDAFPKGGDLPPPGPGLRPAGGRRAGADGVPGRRQGRQGVRRQGVRGRPRPLRGPGQAPPRGPVRRGLRQRRLLPRPPRPPAPRPQPRGRLPRSGRAAPQLPARPARVAQADRLPPAEHGEPPRGRAGAGRPVRHPGVPEAGDAPPRSPAWSALSTWPSTTATASSGGSSWRWRRS